MSFHCNIDDTTRREQGTSPYVAQGSSLSYSLKQPPLSYGNFGVGSGYSAPSSSGSSGFSLGSLGSLSGLSSLTSGFGSLGSGLTNSLTNSLGSSLGQNNLFASASGYNPVVIPSGYSSQSGSSPSQGAITSLGTESKILNSIPYSYSDQSSYDSSVLSYLTSQAGQASGQGVPASSASIIPSSAASSSSQYGWSSSGPSSSYSPSAYSGYSSGSVASGSAPASYQVSSGSAPSPSSASSSVSSYSPSNYISSGSSYSSGNQYQRSSSASAFKPIVGSTSYSSGLVGSSSSPSVTYSITSNKSREESRST